MKTQNTSTIVESEKYCDRVVMRDLRELLTKMGDKWSIFLVMHLVQAPMHRARFSELQRMVGGISQRVLTTTLRNLERDGFVTREVFPEVPPRVEYQLTDLGVSLQEPIQFLMDWVEMNWGGVGRAQETFDGARREV